MLKESISGVRGIVGDGLDPKIIVEYCAAFSKILPEGPIILGRDSRPHGEPITALVASTLRLAGRNIIDIGIQATPTVEVVTERTDAAGGIIVTASHNPIQWNALKFLKGDGMFLDQKDFDALRAEMKAAPEWAPHNEVGNYQFLENAEQYHLDAIIWLPWLDGETIRNARFKVVLDSNCGTGSIALLPLLEKLGCEVVSVGCNPDGNFLHTPEPRPENLSTLEKIVRENGADIGLATDPDADRLSLVVETGVAISEEYTLAIGAAEVANFMSGPIVVNLSTSAMIESIGRPVIRTSVGEINVSTKMLEIGSPVGGEGNGGLIVPACHPGRDAALATAVILHRMARTGKKLSELVAEFPTFTMIKERIDIRIEYDRLEKLLREEFSPKSVDTTDGVRIVIDSGWLHVRASNTEPIIRIIVEAESSKQAKSIVERTRKILGA